MSKLDKIFNNQLYNWFNRFLLIVYTVNLYPDKSSKTMNQSIWEERKCEPWPPCFKLLNTEYLVAWEEVNQSWFLQRVRTCSTNHIFLPNANDILECRIKTRITLTEHEWIWLKFFIWYVLRCTVLIYHSRIRSNSGKDLRYKISFESTFCTFTESWYAVEPILRFWSDRNKFHVYT